LGNESKAEQKVAERYPFYAKCFRVGYGVVHHEAFGMTTRNHRSDLNWNLLRDFLTIAAHDSFTEAAKATGTVRPAIS
ncbi:LysR family transcriptional regulator, partial [Burkholderia sp. SIMBA_019]